MKSSFCTASLVALLAIGCSPTDDSSGLDGGRGDGSETQVDASVPPDPKNRGLQNIAVIHVTLQDHPKENYSNDTLSDLVFQQLDAYYREQSYGRLQIAGHTFGSYSLPLASTYSNADELFHTIFVAAMTAADADVDFTHYSRVLIFVDDTELHLEGFPNQIPQSATKQAAAFAANDGNVQPSVSIFYEKSPEFSVIAHEFGHHLNLGHANLLDCGDQALAVAGCTRTEYGDPFSIMGGNVELAGSKSIVSVGHMNIQEKAFVGWLDEGELLTVNQSGSYQVGAIENADSKIKGIRIARNANEFLYLEYRVPVGIDAPFHDHPFGVGAALLHASWLSSARDTYLIDASTPLKSGQRNDVAMTVGVPFVDPASGSRLTVRAASESSVTVDVELKAADTKPPTVKFVTPREGATAAGMLEVSVEANDDIAIDRVEIQFGNLNTVLTDKSAPYTFVLDTTRLLANGNGALEALAYDQAGNLSRPAYVGFTVANADEIAPEIKIISPDNNASVGTLVPLTLRVNDNLGIASVKIYRDGEYYDETPEVQLGVDFIFPRYIHLTPGAHQIFTEARDLAGNLTRSSTLQVTAK